MREIELSVMNHGDNLIQDLQKGLQEFEAKTQIHVRLKVLNWFEGWAELVKVVIYKDGPHISEIGNTWVSDFVSMNALRPFAPEEIESLGGTVAFLPNTLNSSFVFGRPQMWSVPWIADTRVLCYRKDILDRFRIDPQSAFQTVSKLEETLDRLRDNGVENPWVVPTKTTRMSLQQVSSWIWGAGGDLVSEDGKHVLFNQPAGLKGMEEYFRLSKYLSEETRGLGDIQADEFFWNGKAAVTMTGPWLLRGSRGPQDIRPNSGVISAPGVPFVGGSHLVIWQHTLAEDEAFMLVRYLSDPQFQRDYICPSGNLPTREEVLTQPDFLNDPVRIELVDGIQKGRSFPSVPLWGLIEDRLTTEIGHLWKDIFANPGQDIRGLVENRMAPLARRLDLLLAS